jgi:hypothetical protein
MDIKAARIGMKARTPNGRESEIVGIFHDGTIAVDFGPGDYHWIKFNASCLEPVSDPCQDCPKLASIDKCCEYWKAACEEARRNAADWREELEKLQKEALSESDDAQKLTECYEILSHVPDCTQHGAWCPDHMIDWIKAKKHEEDEQIAERDLAPLSEVAKCYIRVEPEKLLMSQDARRVIEYLVAMNHPTYLSSILEGMKGIMSGMAITDGIIEARDAGRISLVDGKYQIVRD